MVAGCTRDLGEHLQSGQVLPLYGLQGRWVGWVQPAGQGCGSSTQGLMTIGGKGFGFDPFQSTAVIRGEIGDDGHLSGSLVRPTQDHRDLSLMFDGQSEGSDAINGVLRSGRCSWTVTLHRG